MILETKQYLLFDADGTVLDFHTSEDIALSATFHQFGYTLTKELKEEYSQINEELWKELERGCITLEQLCTKRFELLFKKRSMEANPKEFDFVYMHRLAERDEVIPDAFEVCETLSKRFQLVIITNGITYVQKKRLECTGLLSFFTHVFVSEEVGYSKPDVRFFESVFQTLKIADKESVLLVGDSLSADIKGGNLFGITTCWFNPNHRANETDALADYEISSLKQLLSLSP